MARPFSLLMILLVSVRLGFTQHNNLISKADFAFLESITKTVLDSSRIFPGQFISKELGANNTGGTIIRPGGRNAYPSFWIRDYAMSLGTGFVSPTEQWHMLQLTASTQCDQSWITQKGSMVPVGAIADHIRIDNSLPIYFPGTYSYEDQGEKQFGMTPPYCDQFYFIQMAHYYLKTTGKKDFLLGIINGKTMIERLELAFSIVPTDGNSHLVYTSDAFRGVDFGFRDVITMTGNLCFASLLKFKAAQQLASLFDALKNNRKATFYQNIAIAIQKAIPTIFMDETGFLKASTQKSQQQDVWSTALAVYLNVLVADDLLKASRALTQAYQQGSIAYRGNIRHVPANSDFSPSTAWEYSLAAKNLYQNGAYWGTPTGWVAHAIAKTSITDAQKLVKEFIDDLKQNDFRKGGAGNAPYECFNETGYTQNPLYLTTVACPFIVLRKAE